MKPSSTTTARRSAAPSATPASSAISNPPRAASTPSGVRRIRPVAVEHAPRRPRPCGRLPARRALCPRPQTATGRGRGTRTRARTRTSCSRCPCLRAPRRSRPCRRARARGPPLAHRLGRLLPRHRRPRRRSRVPGPSRRSRTAGCVERLDRRPRRRLRAPLRARRASTQIAAPPDAKLASICRVTSCGYALTPSAATPWSAAATTIAARSGSRATFPRIRRERSPPDPRGGRGFRGASSCGRARPAPQTALLHRREARAAHGAMRPSGRLRPATTKCASAEASTQTRLTEPRRSR